MSNDIIRRAMKQALVPAETEPVDLDQLTVQEESDQIEPISYHEPNGNMCLGM